MDKLMCEATKRINEHCAKIIARSGVVLTDNQSVTVSARIAGSFNDVCNVVSDSCCAARSMKWFVFDTGCQHIAIKALRGIM